MAVTVRLPRGHTLLIALVVVLFLFLILQNSYFYQSPTFGISIFTGSDNGNSKNEEQKAMPQAEEVKEVVRPPPTDVDAELPGFCDYCEEEDTLCQKYGESNLARAMAFEGSNARLKRVMRKAQAGGLIKVGVIGGSVTRGHGVGHQQRWMFVYEKWWKETFPLAQIKFVDGSVPASETDYYQSCFVEHIDQDVDVVVVEMGINDRRMEHLSYSFELLLRGLLELPNKPAVINLHIVALLFERISMGEDLHAGIAMYYDSPIVSVRNLLLPHILAHPSDPEHRGKNELEAYWFHRMNDGTIDLRHLNFHGHELMADMMIVFSQRTLCNALREDAKKERGITGGGGGYGWTQADRNLPGTEAELGEYVPRVRLLDKYDDFKVTPPVRPTCRSMTSTKNPLEPIANLTSGFTKWAPEQRPDKIYLRATEPGSKIAFKVVVGSGGIVRMSYLRSKTFGMGNLLCWAREDKSGAMVMYGWWEYDNVNLAGTDLVATGLEAGEHTLWCELMKETRDPKGGHDFRIVAVHTV